MAEIKYGRCGCEYPCDCCEFEGKDYGDLEEIIDALVEQRDSLVQRKGKGDNPETWMRRYDEEVHRANLLKLERDRLAAQLEQGESRMTNPAIEELRKAVAWCADGIADADERIEGTDSTSEQGWASAEGSAYENVVTFLRSRISQLEQEEG